MNENLRMAKMRATTVVGKSRVFAAFVESLERRASWAPNFLSVLTYHRVDDPARAPDLYPGLVSATPADFEEHMRYLVDRSHLVSAGELLAVRRGKATLPPRSVMVTFDDAYVDFALNAWPVLRELAIPVVLFVATGYPDHPERSFWWDRLYRALRTTSRTDDLVTSTGRLRLASEDERSRAFVLLRAHVKRLAHGEAMTLVDDLVAELGGPPPEGSRVLGWEELRRLAREGATVAPHSRSHPLLDQLPLGEARAEIEGSIQDLERELGGAPPLFAYPAGGHNDAVVGALADAGIEAAFTTGRGGNDLSDVDWLRLRRINVGRRSTLPLIRAQLLPGRTASNLRRSLSRT